MKIPAAAMVLPRMDGLDIKKDNLPTTVKPVIFLEETSQPDYFTESLLTLNILQNFAALRSIFFKGNRAHHMDHHNAANQNNQALL